MFGRSCALVSCIRLALAGFSLFSCQLLLFACVAAWVQVLYSASRDSAARVIFRVITRDSARAGGVVVRASIRD